MDNLNKYEPDPIPNANRAVWEMVLDDMRERDRTGREKYGTPLQCHNGRRPLVDAYQECLDLVVYLRQEIEERAALEAERDRHSAQLRKILDLTGWVKCATDDECYGCGCRMARPWEAVEITLAGLRAERDRLKDAAGAVLPLLRDRFDGTKEGPLVDALERALGGNE